MKTILIIDDDKNILALLKHRLKEHYKVMITDKANDGINIINNNDIYCLIVDYQMPEIDGIELSKIVRENPKIKSIPIILLTAYKDTALIELAIRSGVNIFMTKDNLNNLNEQNIIDLIDNIEHAKNFQELRNIGDRL